MIVHVAKLASSFSGNKRHVDARDVTASYGVYLGDYSGVSLRCYDSSEEKLTGEFSDPYRLFCFDARLPHEVVKVSSSAGSRYSVMIFKMWDSRFFLEPPLVSEPFYVDFEGGTRLPDLMPAVCPPPLDKIEEIEKVKEELRERRRRRKEEKEKKRKKEMERIRNVPGRDTRRVSLPG